MGIRGGHLAGAEAGDDGWEPWVPSGLQRGRDLPSNSGPRTGFAVKGGTFVLPSIVDVARVTGGFVLWPQRPSLARVVEWIDFETLALLFGMVITGPGSRAAAARALVLCCHCCSPFVTLTVPSSWQGVTGPRQRGPSGSLPAGMGRSGPRAVSWTVRPAAFLSAKENRH